MAGEPSQAPTGASAGARSAPVRDALPFPFWLLFGLGALSCATWLGAALVDLWAAPILTPSWLRYSVHAALVLAVPALILLSMRAPRMPARRHPRAFFMVAALLTLIAALPALPPITTSTNLVSLTLCVPTLSLGVALAAVDPLVIERWRLNRSRDSSIVMAAGAGFGLTALAACITFVVTYRPQCTSGARLWCGGLVAMVDGSVCGGVFLIAIAGLLGAWLGYVIGDRVARADYWW